MAETEQPPHHRAWQGRVPATVGRPEIRLLYGCALAAAPGAVLAACGGPDDSRSRVAARLLGARHLVEGALFITSDGWRRAYPAPAVDGLHAFTMLVVAVRDPRYRRLALLSGAAATGLALSRGGWRS
jgi:hypothetical protein